jgi:hypothetical protein
VILSTVFSGAIATAIIHQSTGFVCGDDIYSYKSNRFIIDTSEFNLITLYLDFLPRYDAIYCMLHLLISDVCNQFIIESSLFLV